MEGTEAVAAERPHFSKTARSGSPRINRYFLYFFSPLVLWVLSY
jgi:hypothetical protein